MDPPRPPTATLAALLVFAAFACSAENDRLGFISDSLGPANAWRLTPSVLLHQCSQTFPESTKSMAEVFDAWSTKNQELISLVERTVSKAAPIYAASLSIPEPEAREFIDASTTRLIIENYLQDERLSVRQVCSDYKSIVVSLSTPGKAAVVRGHVYAVEAALHPSTSR